MMLKFAYRGVRAVSLARMNILALAQQRDTASSTDSHQHHGVGNVDSSLVKDAVGRLSHSTKPVTAVMDSNQYRFLSTGRSQAAESEPQSAAAKPETTVPAKPVASGPLSLLPGVALSMGLMYGGFELASVLGKELMALQGLTEVAKSPISGVSMAILLGMALKNMPLTLPTRVNPGIALCKDKALKAGIMCVGAKLSLMDIAQVGLVGIPVVGLTVATGLTVAPMFGRWFGLTDKMSSLIATGTSICGVTAISALAPTIKASEQETAFAIANVVAFGTINMLATPYIAHAVFENSTSVGVFLGLAVHDTAQVVGSALTYKEMFGDQVAFQTAVLTKLTRNILLAGVIPYMAYKHARLDQQAEAAAAAGAKGASTGGLKDASAMTTPPDMGAFALLKKYTPAFVLGFLGMSVVRSVGDASVAEFGQAFGVLDPHLWKSTVNFIGDDVGSRYLLGTAMAAVGLSTSFTALKAVGWRPFAVGLSAAMVVSTTGFLGASAIPIVQSYLGQGIV
eukprot:m.109244 g.109244  ORF g.109244 m.109244 type:complete len:510 (-) comp13370_c0_seq2:286-1815(-)